MSDSTITDTNAGNVSTPTERSALEEVAAQYADAIAAGAAYREYQAAYEALQQDANAKALFAEYQRRSNYVQAAGQWGGVREQDGAELERLEREMSEHSTIARYRASQTALVEELRELNAIMGEELGIDFAAMVRPSSCGCH